MSTRTAGVDYNLEQMMGDIQQSVRMALKSWIHLTNEGEQKKHVVAGWTSAAAIQSADVKAIKSRGESMSLYRFAGRMPVVSAKSYVSEAAVVIGDVKIDNDCYIGHGAILRGDHGAIEVGSCTAIEEGVIIHAFSNSVCRIGKNVTIGHGAIVHAENIEDYAVIGMGAILSLHAKIGSWTIVAEGCVVKNHQIVPEGVVVAGNPAKIVRSVEARDREFWLWGKQLYVDLAQQYLRDGMEQVK
ncbi:MAG: putative lipopolysaccharide biosynthesis O-acetyl transferase WbbJ [Pelotomaculum sp. PtaB.Bin104]|nr:MAG: putative lipopolysaccharide biosynthesis O-acetyl transferase WbbJ [Pelotomaculum sp. PtaB.Bin104]